MTSTTRSLLPAALPALIAGWIVLFIAQVGTGILAVQAVATVLMVLLAFSGKLLPDRVLNGRFRLGCLVLAAVACAVPLLFPGDGPKRWVNLGPVRLYVASVVLPFALTVSGALFRGKSNAGMAAIVAIGLILAVQPDFSQVLALSAGFLVMLLKSPASIPARLTSSALLAVACALAYAQPDPLKPVPYVEGVFELAFRHSIFSGVAVVLCAVAFLGLLAKGLRPFTPGFLGIPAYYAVLYGCSLAGLTPAPLIGFGAGPLLGFGLLVAAASMHSGQLTMDNFHPKSAD